MYTEKSPRWLLVTPSGVISNHLGYIPSIHYIATQGLTYTCTCTCSSPPMSSLAVCTEEYGRREGPSGRKDTELTRRHEGEGQPLPAALCHPAAAAEHTGWCFVDQDNTYMYVFMHYVKWLMSCYAVQIECGGVVFCRCQYSL